MPMNNRILRPLARPLLLDAVPGAAAAYSLRQLSNAYTGPVVTVRRSSDDAEADFKASEIDDGTLAAFCGAGDGLVKTWHDQSGNGRDASQGTAANQPKIVDSGSVVLEEGKPAIRPDGTNDFLTNTGAYWSTFVTNNFSTFAVMEKTSDTDKIAWAIGNATSDNANWLVGRTGVAGDYQYRGKRVSTSFTGIATNATGLFSSFDIPVASGGGAQIDFTDGTNAVANNTVVPDRLVLFDRRAGASTPFSGAIQEIIYYPSDQTANRERIEGDLAWYY